MQHLQNTGGDILRPKSFSLSSALSSLQFLSALQCLCGSSVFHLPYTLPSSVCCNSCVCHSCENCRVCTNNSHSGTRHSPLATILKFFHWPELANRHGRIPSTCFLFNFQLSTVNFQYNRCASIRGRNEFPPAPRRDTNRLRASLLGRQHQRDLRAPLLLRRVRLSRQLSPRKAEFPHRTNRHAHRNFWRH